MTTIFTQTDTFDRKNVTGFMLVTDGGKAVPTTDIMAHMLARATFDAYCSLPITTRTRKSAETSDYADALTALADLHADDDDRLSNNAQGNIKSLLKVLAGLVAQDNERIAAEKAAAVKVVTPVTPEQATYNGLRAGFRAACKGVSLFAVSPNGGRKSLCASVTHPEYKSSKGGE